MPLLSPVRFYSYVQPACLVLSTTCSTTSVSYYSLSHLSHGCMLAPSPMEPKHFFLSLPGASVSSFVYGYLFCIYYVDGSIFCYPCSISSFPSYIYLVLGHIF